MDIQTRLIERNGTAAEKFCHERLKNNRAEIDKLNTLNSHIYMEIEKLQHTCKHIGAMLG